MTLRGWLSTCMECQWNAHALLREHIEVAKRAHELSTGHRNVTVYPAAEGDPIGSRYAGSDLPPEAQGIEGEEWYGPQGKGGWSIFTGFQCRFNGTVHGTGQTDWSVDHRRLPGSTLEMTIQGVLEVTGQGQVIRGAMREVISQRLQALAPESITVPAVSPDVLIAAGKGIGT